MTELLIAGLDEVGRGPLAGPVVAAAVILDPSNPVAGLRDSKKLSAGRREQLDVEIRAKALAWCIGWSTVEEIDALNILQATFLAMSRAVEGLLTKPDHVMVDGNQTPPLPYPCTAIIQGDDKIPAISAASIIAKVARDHYMQQMDDVYPGYGFSKHAGYPTALHLAQLNVLGVSPIHRKSFGPVRRLLE
jgi:ribonuclease HII